MQPWMFPLLLVAAVVLVVAVVKPWCEKRYTSAWQQAAEQLGLTYFSTYDSMLGAFARLTALQRGRKQQIPNAIVACDGDLQIVVADFRYITGQGKSTQRHAETLCLVRNPTLSLPACLLRPQRRVLDFLAKLFGGQDIDFGEDSEFSSAYVLQGQLVASVRQMFDSSTRDWFTQWRGKNLHFEAQGEMLVFHYSRKVPPDRARELIAEAIELQRLLACPVADEAAPCASLA